MKEKKTNTDCEKKDVEQNAAVNEPGTEANPESIEEKVEQLSLEDRLEKVMAENESLKNQCLRSIADYTNLKQRSDRERRDIIIQANARLIGRLLPVIDNFERALSCIADPSVSEGVVMIYRQLLDILQAEGLEKIDCEGQPFDPHFHEALMQEQCSETHDNTVLQVFEPGYRFKNKLLRAAKVKVSSN